MCRTCCTRAAEPQIHRRSFIVTDANHAPALAAAPDTAAILAALQQFNADITTRLDKSDQSNRIATSSPFVQALFACLQLVAAENVLPPLLVTAIQEGDKQGLNPECLLWFIPA